MKTAIQSEKYKPARAIFVRSTLKEHGGHVEFKFES